MQAAFEHRSDRSMACLRQRLVCRERSIACCRLLVQNRRRIVEQSKTPLQCESLRWLRWLFFASSEFSSLDISLRLPCTFAGVLDGLHCSMYNCLRVYTQLRNSRITLLSLCTRRRSALQSWLALGRHKFRSWSEIFRSPRRVWKAVLGGGCDPAASVLSTPIFVIQYSLADIYKIVSMLIMVNFSDLFNEFNKKYDRFMAFYARAICEK